MTPNEPRPALRTRLARKMHEVGVRYTLTLGIRTLVPAALFRFTRMTILEILSHNATAPTARDESTRWAAAEDLRQLEALGHTAEILRHRFAAGARACILTEEKDILAYVWFHARCHDEEDLGVRFLLGPREIWLFDAMVKANQRGQGLYPRLLRAATRDLGQEGMRRILIAIESRNRNSLRAHQAAGAEPIGMVCVLRLLGFTFVRCGRHVRAAWTGTGGCVLLPTSGIA